MDSCSVFASLYSHPEESLNVCLLLQSNGTALDERIRYFGIQNNYLNGSLPAYLSDRVLSDISRVNVMLQVCDAHVCIGFMTQCIALGMSLYLSLHFPQQRTESKLMFS